HVLERMVEFAYLAAGARISYAESMDAVPGNIAEVRPTVVASVPRFFEKAHDRILAAVGASPFPQRLVFALALALGKRRARAVLARRPPPPVARLLHPYTDRLVSPKTRDTMGGRIRSFRPARAPLPPDLA